MNHLYACALFYPPRIAKEMIEKYTLDCVYSPCRDSSGTTRNLKNDSRDSIT